MVDAMSGFALAAIGKHHFGNPIPPEWYTAARELEEVCIARLAKLEAANKEWHNTPFEKWSATDHAESLDFESATGCYGGPEVPHAAKMLRELDAANKEWHDKTEWLRKDLQPHELGKHLADVLRARLEKAEQRIGHLGSALGDIASGEILRSNCNGPHCTEEMGVATADEMAGRAAGALEWDAKNAV